MVKLLEIFFIVFLCGFSFFLGVKHSDGAKSHLGWIFEENGGNQELPELANTENPEEEVGKEVMKKESSDKITQENNLEVKSSDQNQVNSAIQNLPNVAPDLPAQPSPSLIPTSVPDVTRDSPNELPLVPNSNSDPIPNYQDESINKN